MQPAKARKMESNLDREVMMNPNPRWTGLAKFSSVYLRLALGVAFLSAVADRFGCWGAYGQPNVAWGNYARFVNYTTKLNWFLPATMVPALATVATVVETLFGILLVLGWKTRITTLQSGVLLTTFALTMTMALGMKSPLDFSVFSAAGGALLLGGFANFPVSLDEYLRRNRQRSDQCRQVIVATATTTTMMKVGIIMSYEQRHFAPLALLRQQSWLSPAFPTGSYSYSHGLEWSVYGHLVPGGNRAAVDKLDELPKAAAEKKTAAA
jgi:uncharacterized membrane protein YphA (DoxX/SURF4 family)